MIAYVTLGTNDRERAIAFYDELFSVIGAKRAIESDNIVTWAVGGAPPMVGIIRPNDGNAATAGNGTMVALALENPAQVDALHRKALELGGADEGAPGPRGDTYYIGYFRDLDGNKLNGFTMA